MLYFLVSFYYTNQFYWNYVSRREMDEKLFLEKKGVAMFVCLLVSSSAAPCFVFDLVKLDRFLRKKKRRISESSWNPMLSFFFLLSVENDGFLVSLSDSISLLSTYIFLLCANGESACAAKLLSQCLAVRQRISKCMHTNNVVLKAFWLGKYNCSAFVFVIIMRCCFPSLQY